MVAWLPGCVVAWLFRYLVAWHLTLRHLTPDTFNHKTPSSHAGTRARTPAVPPWFPPMWAGTRSGTAWGKAYARAPVTGGETGAPTGGLRPVRFAAPEGFSACHRRPASTVPDSLWACHRPTRLHQRLFVCCPNYATRRAGGQPLTSAGMLHKPWASVRGALHPPLSVLQWRRNCGGQRVRQWPEISSVPCGKRSDMTARPRHCRLRRPLRPATCILHPASCIFSTLPGFCRIILEPERLDL